MHISRRSFMLTGTSLAALTHFPGASGEVRLLEQARILVGFPPGGGTDAAARRVAEALRGVYAKVVVVDNKPGAAGRIAIDEMRRSPLDGSVMVVQPEAVLTQQPLVDPKNTNYKMDDLVAVAAVGSIQHAFAVGPAVPASVRTMKDFFEWVRLNPSKANFGTPGTHSAQDLLMRLAGPDVTGPLTHAPYRGSAPGVQDLIAGQISGFFSPVGDSLPYLGSGRMRLLGTSGDVRSKFAPDVSTFTEQGLPGMTLVEYFGVWAARGVPEAARAHAASAIREAMAQPANVEALARLGIEASSLSQPEFAAAIRTSHAAWSQRLQKMGFKPDN